MFITAAGLIPRIGMIIIFSMLCLVNYGQPSSRYSGPLEIAGYSGNSVFFYMISGGDSIRQGPFEFRSTDINALLADTDKYAAISGQFSNDQPAGDWSFHFGTYEQGRGVSVQNTFYQVDVSGERHIARGRLSEGKPDGRFIQTVEILENSVVTSTPFSSSFTFSKGIPQSSFQIQNDDMTLVGRFLRSGLAHDQWELIGGELAGIQERWTFRNGTLEQIEIRANDEARTIDFNNLVRGESTEINLDARYIRLIELKFGMSSRKGQPFQSGIYALLKENTDHYQKISDILIELGSDEFLPEYKVRADRFPISPAERTYIDSLHSLMAHADQVRTNLDDDSQLQLLELADHETSFLMAAADSLYASFLSPVHKLLDYDEGGILEFVRRQEVVRFLELTNEVPRELIINFADSTRTETLLLPSVQSEPDAPALETTYRISKMAVNQLDSINAILQKRISTEKREQILASLEEELIDAMNKLEEATDSLANGARGQISSEIKNISQVARRFLKEYSALENSEVKVDEARSLINCMEQLEMLASELALLPSREDAIVEVYTDQVWNPFTATVMEEQVKRRILSSYREILIPTTLQEIQTDLSCSNAQALQLKLRLIDQRMIELREEDTSKLERKLKREDDPQKILALFGIKPVDE